MQHRPLSALIAEYELDWRAAAWPADLEGVFGRRAPLVLEIGYGNGEFLVDLARAAPEHDHLGIEVSWASALRLYKRLDHARLSNVRAVLGEAEEVLSVLLRPGQVAAVHVNHPCPWPKERHHARRLVRPAFLSLLADRMAPGAPLLIATDHAGYADWIAAHLEREPGLVSRHPTARVHEIRGRRPTKYERKALEQGLRDHFFEWERRPGAVAPAPAAPPLPPRESEDEMPSLTLAGRRRSADPFDGFAPLAVREERDGVEIVVKLAAAYRDSGGGRWLVEALTQEGPLRQDFALLVLEREGRLLVKLGHLGSPHPTEGVKRAVWHLGRWLLGREPGLEIVHHNLGGAYGARHPSWNRGD